MSGPAPSAASRALLWLLGSQTVAQRERVEGALEITWPVSVWLLLAVLLISAVWIVAMYCREPTNARRPLILLLACLRSSLIALVLLMLLGLVETQFRTGLPDLVLLIDDSSSMAYEDEPQGDGVPAARLDRVRALLLDNAVLETLQQRYQLRLRWLEDTTLMATTPEPQQQPAEAIRTRAAVVGESRIGDRIEQIVLRQRGRPTAALLLFSDGVVTGGASLKTAAQVARRAGIPLHTVVVGNEQPPRDVELVDVSASDTVFAGDVVTFDFGVRASGLDTQQVQVTLRRLEEPTAVAQRLLEIPADQSLVRGRLWHRPVEEANVDYVLEVAAVSGETNTENNVYEKTVVVITDPLRVLLVQSVPSFEYRFLKQLLQRQRRGDRRSFELDVVLQSGDAQLAEIDDSVLPVFPLRAEALFDYDVIVLGDADPALLSRTSLEHIYQFVARRGGGLLMFAGPRFMPRAYLGTPLEPLFPFTLGTVGLPLVGQIMDEGFGVQPTSLGLNSPHMQLGDTPGDNVQLWRQLPLMFWMADLPELKPAAKVLAVRAADAAVNSPRHPLICVQYVGAGKVLFHTTDEMYRWRFRRGDQAYARYWLQTIRFLSRGAAGQRGLVELRSDREVYELGEPVHVRARFRDDGLAPSADDGVNLVLQREGQRRIHRRLTRRGAERGIFASQLNGLPAGRYHGWLLAPAVSAGAPTCDFVINAKAVEQVRMTAATAALQDAAEISGGTCCIMDEAEQLINRLPPAQRVRVESLPPRPLWNSWLLPLLFVILITVEWVLRQRSGLA